MNRNASNALRSLVANSVNELQHQEPVTQIKALDSQFESFGDALFSWVNAQGFENPNEKGADSGMVRAFCTALQLPWIGISSQMLDTTQYFESDAWLFKFLEDKGFIRQGRGDFFLLDEGNRPIVYVDFGTNPSLNIFINAVGSEAVVMELREAMKANVKVDASKEKKATYAEVVASDGMMGMGAGLRCVMGTIENRRIALPEYYPYLEGGMEALIQDFIESDESVLILMGNPGTGKSSGIAAVEALDLLPIYAKRAKTILDKDFVNFVFSTSDDYMAKIAGTAAKARSDLFVETLSKEREFSHQEPLSAKTEEKEEPRIPVIVVEDADTLLRPRSEGNLIMPELLNETDGIGSNHTRKIVFTTNLASLNDIDEALRRPGRCYGVIHCRLLTPEEGVAARRANGLPDFDVVPAKDVSLAEALRKPRKKISISNGKAVIGFTG
jgi:hypothetical protein